MTTIVLILSAVLVWLVAAMALIAFVPEPRQWLWYVGWPLFFALSGLAMFTDGLLRLRRWMQGGGW